MSQLSSHRTRSGRLYGAVAKATGEHVSTPDKEESSRDDGRQSVREEEQPSESDRRELQNERMFSNKTCSTTSLELRKRQALLTAAEAKASLVAERVAREKLRLEQQRKLEQEEEEARQALIDARLEVDLISETDIRSVHSSTGSEGKNHFVKEWLYSSGGEDVERDAENTGTQRLQGLEALTQANSEVVRKVGTTASTNNDRLLARLSSKKLPPFFGDPMEWLRFKHAFEVTTRTGEYSDEENVTRLQQCLRGEARNAVLAQLMTTCSAESIMKTLQLRFGRPENIIEKMLLEIKKIPRLTGSQADLVTLATKVDNCVAAMTATQYYEYLHSPELLKEVLKKMTEALILKWHDYLANEKDRKPNDPRLPVLANFLMREAEQACSAGTVETVKFKKEEYRPISKQTCNFTEEKLKKNKKKSKFESEKASVTKCSYCSAAEHMIDSCNEFRMLNLDDKWCWVRENKKCFLCLKEGHRRRVCEGKKCSKCNLFHHDVLHSDRNEKKETEITSNLHGAGGRNRRILLKVMSIEVEGVNGKEKTLALFDEGSTVTLIDETLAKKIGAKGQVDQLHLKGVFGEEKLENSSKKVEFQLSTAEGNFKIKNARTIKDLNLMHHSLDEEELKKYRHLRNIQIEQIDGTPKILIGQDNWDLIVTRELKENGENQPVASRTKLGWVIHGFSSSVTKPLHTHKFFHLAEDPDTILHELIKKSFDIENLGMSSTEKVNNSEEKRATNILENTTKRVGERWETGLLWKKDDFEFPDNQYYAERRLNQVERRMDKDLKFSNAYRREMGKLISKGYASEVTEADTFIMSKKKWILPHFGVVNLNKPDKLRLVFDAAAETSGVSLNKTLLTGPDLLNSMLGILMKFRENEIAIMADIEEMFLRVKLRPQDQHAQCFLWRGKERDHPPKLYKMESLIFGSASSPCSAIYVMNRNAQDFLQTHPQAVDAIKRKHYMDNYLDSVSNSELAKKLIRDVSLIHAKGGFRIRDWISNSAEALEEVEEKDKSAKIVGIIMDDKEYERTLGLLWNFKEDTLGFNSNLKKFDPEIIQGKRKPTKRELLKIMMTVFDPLGFLAPLMVKAKILMQDVWKSGIKWDEQLSDDMTAKFMTWLRHVVKINEVKIPRCYCLTTQKAELHVFCDASEKAYTAVAYWRTSIPNVRTALVASKNRVAPLKVISIPRLELQAALMGCKLSKIVEDSHDIKITRKCFWTDSQTVWQWINSEPRTYKQFVAHRLTEIKELSREEDWRWLPSQENVADIATREDGPQKMLNWIKGPDFLLQPEHMWPKNEIKLKGKLHEEARLESRSKLVTYVEEGTFDYLPPVNRFSKWRRLVRSTAYVLYFASRLKKEKPVLNVELLERAEKLLLKRSQYESFYEEIQAIKKKQHLSAKSRIRDLIPFIDDDGILRIRGRIQNTENLSEEMKHPPILDGKHDYVRLIIRHFHIATGHHSHETVINELRQQYWILKLRPMVKSICSQCSVCRARRAACNQPLMGNLPEARLLHHCRPFTNCGIDLFGPIEITVGRHREKRYGVIFTCLSVRAVHVEIVSSLTTDSMIMALRRMSARRGYPSKIFCDNGTNLRGANVELKRALLDITANNEFQTEVAERNCEWHFIPPAAPNFGGVYERLVQSIKTALKATMKERHPKEEVLATLLAEAENIVNSRPITHVSTDWRDPEALTPNHFLIGTSSNLPIAGVFKDDDLTLRKQWRISQKLADMFWCRWMKEYLPTLQKRQKWIKDERSLQKGDVVIIGDPNSPRNLWPKGIVTEVFPGKDGRVRVVDVRTKGGVLRRPANKLVLLVPTQN